MIASKKDFENRKVDFCSQTVNDDRRCVPLTTMMALNYFNKALLMGIKTIQKENIY
jgi:hypothetical protein